MLRNVKLLLLLLATTSARDVLAAENPLLLGKQSRSPLIVDTVRSPLTKAVVGRLSEYLHLCLKTKPRIVDRVPTSGSEPLIVLGRIDLARTYEVPLPPPGDAEAFSLNTRTVLRTMVIVSGATDKGIKRGVQRLILLTKQDSGSLLLPPLRIADKPWKSSREFTVDNWRPDNVRLLFANRLADKRLDFYRLGDAQKARYIWMMDDLGFNGVQFNDDPHSWSENGSIEAYQEMLRKCAEAAHAIGQHVSYFVYAAEFTEGWSDPEAVYKPQPGMTAFDDPRVRRTFEKYYDHYSDMAPYVDLVIGHWFDSGELTDLRDVINYQKLLRQKMLAMNPHLKFAVNTWGNDKFLDALLDAGMNDFLILETSMPGNAEMKNRPEYRRNAKAKGLQVGMWGWDVTEWEMDQLANMHVNGHVLKQYIDSVRNGAEQVLPSSYWSENDGHHINNIYTLYQAAQLLWNPDRDPDEILSQISEAVWGPRDGPAVYQALKLIEDTRTGPTWETYNSSSPWRADKPDDDVRRASECLDKLATLKPDPDFVPKITLPVSRETMLELLLPHLEQIRRFARFRVRFQELEKLQASGASKEELAAKIAEAWQPIPEFNTWIGVYGQVEARWQEQMIREFCAGAGLEPTVPKWKIWKDSERALEKIQSEQRVMATQRVFRARSIAGEFSVDPAYAQTLVRELISHGWIEPVASDQYRLVNWQDIAFPVRVRLGSDTAP
jgi:hypothetical protein